jgi:hypothetical protein
MTIPGLEGRALDLTVTCDGYEPYRTPPFEWKVGRYTCSPRDLGTISLQRDASMEAEPSPEGRTAPSNDALQWTRPAQASVPRH